MTLKRLTRAGCIAVLVAHVLAWPGGVALAAGPGYVALGDSIEFGVGTQHTNGWVWQFWEYLKTQQPPGPDTELVNLGTPGDTTRQIRLRQLAPALMSIATHDPVVVSWGGGGNDLRDFIMSPQAATCLRGNPSCLARLNALLNEAEQTIDLTVKALRAAAGPDAKILLRTQYNPFFKSGCDPTLTQAGLAHVVLEGDFPPFLTRGLNDRIRDVAATYGARVIEIYGWFVYGADALVAADCIHPSDAGHGAIAYAAALAF